MGFKDGRWMAQVVLVLGQMPIIILKIDLKRDAGWHKLSLVFGMAPTKFLDVFF